MDMDKSPVSECFGGVLKTTIRYSASKASASLEPFWSIALDLSDNKRIALEDALKAYFAEEKIEGVYNDSTKLESRIGKRVEIERGPQVLVLHLKRFMFDGSTAHKTLTRVEFPETLSLQEFYCKGANPLDASYPYDLIGVVSHHGNKMHQGHYTAAIRQPSTLEWSKLDDHSVASVNQDQVLQDQQVTAYLLIYERSNTITSSNSRSSSTTPDDRDATPRPTASPDVAAE